MRFDWNAEKNERTLRERGFDFAFASLIFAGHTHEWPDDRFDYGENRVCAIGETGGFLIFVVYVDRGETRRMISARLANRKERGLWQQSASR